MTNDFCRMDPICNILEDMVLRRTSVTLCFVTERLEERRLVFMHKVCVSEIRPKNGCSNTTSSRFPPGLLNYIRDHIDCSGQRQAFQQNTLV